MIGASVAASWLLIAVAAGVLWATWGILGVTFDMIERWHSSRRRRPATEGAGKLRKEKESSASP